MYKVISTFCGLGGSSTGYELGGMQVVASVEFLDYQARNYRRNHPNTRVYEADIRKLNPAQILADLGLKPGELDIFDGSPPCSSFSTAGLVSEGWGKEKKYGNQVQATDNLFAEYFRFLRVIQPKICVAENVSGLLKGDSKGHFNNFLREFDAAGYTVTAKLMNAANYGVAQKRQRVIFVGVRKDLGLEPVFPKAYGTIRTAGSALLGVVNTAQDLADVAGVGKDGKPYAIIEALRTMQPGQTHHKYFSLVKTDPRQPANTITATAGDTSAASICHWDNRKFTVPELLRLQSFPDSYALEGAYQQRVEGIGRSVAPKMYEALARTLAREVLDRIPKT
jgi:DNA (cytosine-5)-methyltransferase 1